MRMHRGSALTLTTLVLAGAALCAQTQAGPSGWYVGGELGAVNIKIPGKSLEMEGIQFTNLNASADNAGFKAYGGYWITEHFGFEMGLASMGQATATFDYFQPPAETGTGTTDVSISNITLSFQGAQQVGPVFLFLRGGVQFWRLSYDTRFRLATGQTQYRVLDKNGNSLFYGLGMEWRIKGPWNLRLEGEVLKMDITDVRMISMGVSYTFH